jgi:hypothetical protein
MRRIASLLVCSATVLLSGTKALAEVIWKGDFQTGDLSQWTEVETDNPNRLAVIPTTAPEGYRYSLMTVVTESDLVNNGHRTEVDYLTDKPQEGEERYYHWKTYFPNNYKSDNVWQIFTQWHQYTAGGSPPLAIMVWGENIQLGNNLDHYYWTTPLVRGVWHDFIIHVVFSSDASKGGVEVWYDGQHALGLSHGATLFPQDTVFLKQGLYRSPSITWDQVVYNAGMTVGTTLNDVLTTPQSDGAPTPNPLAPPPPTGHTTSSGSGGSTGKSSASAAPSATSSVTINNAHPGGGCSNAGLPAQALALVAGAWLWRRRGRSKLVSAT